MEATRTHCLVVDETKQRRTAERREIGYQRRVRSADDVEKIEKKLVEGRCTKERTIKGAEEANNL
jgi:hypothetical protein